MNWSAADVLLRGDIAATPSIRTCLCLGASGSALLGLALGGSSGEPWLAVFAAIKVPLLVLLSATLCLPAFFVVNTVLGLGDDFRSALRAILAAQATLGLALGALSPVLVVQAVSVSDPYALTLLDGVLFAVATWLAQHMLSRHYRPLVEKNKRHRLALNGWLVLYVFAGVQMAWVLRPFRGTEGFAVQFLRPEAFEQTAYVVLIEHLTRMLR